MMQAELIREEVSKVGDSLFKSVSNVERKARTFRTFRTFMTNEELAERNIAVMPSSLPESIGRWFIAKGEGGMPDTPVLHAVDWQKVEHVAPLISWTTKAATRRSNLLEKIEARIASLKGIAREEDVPISEKSVSNAQRFLSNLNFTIAPSVFLSGNGNLRIVWENSKNEQVAFQVKSEKDEVQYVIFRLNEDNEFEQILGFMSFKSVYSFLEGLGLSTGLIRESAKHGRYSWL